MGLFGSGGKNVPATGSPGALAQSVEGQPDGAFAASAQRLVQRLLAVGIDGSGPFDSARTVADAALRENAHPEAAVSALAARHLRLATASGFVTSLGGFVTLPLALPANVTGFYLLSTRMTAAVATLRGYDVTEPHVRTAVLLTLVGADADDLLAKAGVVVPTGRLSSLAAQRLPGPALMVVNKAVGFRILASAGRDVFARFGRAVPLVGGAVGAGMDAWLFHRIVEQAKREFPPVAGQITAG